MRVGIVAAMVSTSVAICPDCAPGLAARAAIREDPELGQVVAAVVLPFVIVALVAATLHRLGRAS